MTNGTNLLAAAIAGDGSYAIRYATRTSAGWSAWQSLVGAGATRGYLSGSGCDQTGRAALTWTVGDTPPYQVVTMRVDQLIP